MRFSLWNVTRINIIVIKKMKTSWCVAQIWFGVSWFPERGALGLDYMQGKMDEGARDRLVQ